MSPREVGGASIIPYHFLGLDHRRQHGVVTPCEIEPPDAIPHQQRDRSNQQHHPPAQAATAKVFYSVISRPRIPSDSTFTPPPPPPSSAPPASPPPPAQSRRSTANSAPNAQTAQSPPPPTSRSRPPAPAAAAAPANSAPSSRPSPAASDSRC